MPHADPIRQFTLWFDEALKSQLLDVNAMTLATAIRDRRAVGAHRAAEGRRRARLRVLHQLRERQGPRPGGEPARVACCSSGPSSNGRSGSPARSRGRRAQESASYFHSRPLESQIGAWASRSRAAPSPIDRGARSALRGAGRAVRRRDRCRCRRSGAAIASRPTAIEFWQGRKSRLHDRLLYTRQAGSWSRSRLAP